MHSDQLQLWSKIKKFELNDPNSDFSFTDRLARENSWTLEFSSRAILEYKKFIYLICAENGPLTPSDQVDQVWHLHLLYTESYWKDFCQNTLNRQIQHGPTKGGSSEKAKYDNLYERTKDAYEVHFGYTAPVDIWPPSHIRFGHLRFTRVNLHTHWTIPKPKFLLKWKN